MPIALLGRMSIENTLIRGWFVGGLILGLLASGCGDGTQPLPDPGTAEFDDHAVDRFDSAEAFLALADQGQTPAQLKFVLSALNDPEAGRAWFMDPRFYSLHDEWLWFHLLNGQALPGVDLTPIAGEYATIDAIYQALSDVEELPLQLKWVQSRLYSPLFYRLALGRYWDAQQKAWVESGRTLGVGSLLHFPANPDRAGSPDPLWVFELEYVDRPDEAVLLRFVERLKAVLPNEVGQQLRWLARPSMYQEKLADTLRNGSGALQDRVLTYADLVVPGEVQTYNPGIVAGRISTFEPGTLGGASVGPEDIVVTADIPDYLPPVAAIVSGVPQTPLAHLNLLARSRGTPNVYVGGIMSDPLIADWALFHTPVIVEVTADDVRWASMTQAEYSTYRERLGLRQLEVPQTDLTAAPYLVDLTAGGLAEMKPLVPLTGGKAAAFLALQSVPEVEVPLAPLAISIRAYKEHLAPVLPVVMSMLAHPAFENDGRVRYIALEGVERFENEHSGDPAALAWLSGFLADVAKGSGLTGLINSGGLKAMLRARSVDSSFEAELTNALAIRYAGLATNQGLRFRSSSTAEDVEGFNGAGLYDSNTGFLNPALLPNAKDHKKSVTWALKKTWASYWSFEAFEERRSAGIQHLEGNMGVLVHPRHDDPLEQANGVLTFTLARHPNADFRDMVVNVQHGDLSVTNPAPGQPAAPEIDHVGRPAGADPIIHRVQPSSEVPDGAWVLSEAELVWLFARCELLADSWLDQANSARHPAEQHTTLILDFEFKKMAAAWPQTADGSTAVADRLVLKQVRPLDRPVTLTLDDLAGERVPSDLLGLTVRVQDRHCQSNEVSFRSLELYTDAAANHLMDHSARPFAAFVAVRFADSVPVDGLKTGTELKIGHSALAAISHPDAGEDVWAVEFTLPPQAAKAWGFDSFTMGAGGDWAVAAGEGGYSSANVTCTVQDRVVGPTLYLQGLMAAKLAD